MTDIHIDDFYKDVAKVFAFLYLQFPRPAAVYVEDIAGADRPDEFGLHSPRHTACFSAMLWMADSGYLRYVDTVRQEAIDQAVLTQKAFTLLTTRSTLADKHPKATDESLPASVAEEYATNIHQVRLALKSGSSVQIRQIIRYLMEQSRHH